MLYAIVDKDGTVEAAVRGTVDDAIVQAQQMGFDPWLDQTIEDDPTPRELEDLYREVAANPDGVTPELAWERLGYLQMDFASVDAMSLERAHELLVPYFPRFLEDKKFKAGATAKKGELPIVWQTPEKMAEQFTKQNYKTAKKFPLEPVQVMGLNLLPQALWSKGDGRLVGVRARQFPSQAPVWTRGAQFNLCVGASKECIRSCLVYTGQNTLDPYHAALKEAFTTCMFTEPIAFGRMLLESCIIHRGTGRKKATPMMRLNVYSDVPWELVFPELFIELSDLQFYDYTKVPGRSPPDNYDLTFSYSGRNEASMRQELATGRKAAIVFLDSKKYADESLPATDPRHWGVPPRFEEYEVVAGDLSDVRPYDHLIAEGPPPYVVGLTWKTPTPPVNPRELRFVVPVSELEGRLVAAITPRQEPDTDVNAGEMTEGAGVPDPAEVQRSEEEERVHLPIARNLPKGSSVSDEVKRKLMRG